MGSGTNMSNKYEGHTVRDMTFSQAGERLWFLEHPNSHNASDCMTMNKETLDLIMDSPNLLAKVKRLDEMLSLAHEWVASNLGDDVELEAFLAYIDIGGEEE